MAVEQSLMVIPAIFPYDEQGKIVLGQGLPEFLLLQDGLWKDMSLVPTERQELLRNVLEPVHDQIANFMETVGSPDSTPDRGMWLYLRALLEELYKKLVPEGVSAVLDEAASAAQGDDAPILYIHTHDVQGIPWEILHDGQDFIGMRFQIARLPILSDSKARGTVETVRTVRRIHSLLGARVLEGALLEDWETTFSDLVTPYVTEQRWSDEECGAAGPDLSHLYGAVAADILHITCHGRWDESYYWTLNSQKNSPFQHRIDARLIKSLRLGETRPLVFGNACASAGTTTAGTRGSWMTDLGAAFFASGAQAFVGTVAPITRRIAVAFARKFYQNLLGLNMPLGKALWATKKHFADSQEADPSWLFYCLYGLPNLRFQLATD